MGGNFNYRKLKKDYSANEKIILLHAIVKQRNKMLWSIKRLNKISKSSMPVIRALQKGINKEIDNLK